MFLRIVFVISVLAATVFIGCQRNGDFFSISKPYSEYRAWLTTNGQAFVSGTLNFELQNGSKAEGNLDWSKAKKVTNNTYEFLIVPFVFSSSPFKNGQILLDETDSNTPTLHHLIFRKDKAGKIEATWRSRAFYKHIDINERRIIETRYSLDGTFEGTRLNTDKESFIWGEETYDISTTNSNNNRTSASATCGITYTVTTVSISCHGTTMDDTYCIFKRTKRTYGYCTNGSGNPSVEPESIEPEDDGWYEYMEIEEEFENQHIIDSLQGYPCAQDILKKIPNINNTVSKLIDSIFGINQDVNLTFKADTSLKRDSLINGYTPRHSGSGADWFEQNIFFNPWVLENSSKEYTAGTMLHEGIHCVIGYYWERYQRWRYDSTAPSGIDSNSFKEKFPIFWDYKRTLTPTELAEHNEMAGNYVAKLASFFKSFNSNIDNNMAEALAWKGLQGTTAWKAKGADTINLINLANLARRHSDTTGFYGSKLSKCD